MAGKKGELQGFDVSVIFSLCARVFVPPGLLRIEICGARVDTKRRYVASLPAVNQAGGCGMDD